jgi:hypothetical protein
MEKLPGITLDYQAKARPPREAGALLYEMALYALKAAAESGADTIILKVTGEKAVTVRVIDDGKSRQRKNVLAIPVALAEAMGLRVTITTGKSTIVSISHAARSTTSRRP